MEVSSVKLGALSEASNLSSTNSTEESTPTDSVRPEHLLEVVSFALRIDIPHIDLDKEGVSLNNPVLLNKYTEKLAYSLGSGASCVVTQHEVGDEVGDSAPAGTVVALKRYIQKIIGDEKEQALMDRKMLRLVWQDLRVFTHPFLKAHENIPKLLFLAWEDNTLIPALALELATNGTLEWFLDTEGNISNQEKAHLSLDISTGIAALHACDFVHGDIKPSNIIIRQHDERRVIAQLCDFAGVGKVDEYETPGHIGFGTPEWLAPEILAHVQSPNWQKADVYSMGLVIAYLWWPTRDITELSSEKDLPEDSAENNRSHLWLFRAAVQDGTIALGMAAWFQSLLKEHLFASEGFAFDSLLGTYFLALFLYVDSALSDEPAQRTTAAELMETLSQTALLQCRKESSNRLTTIPSSMVEEIENIPPKGKVLRTGFTVLPTYVQRSSGFHAKVVEYMTKSLPNPLPRVDDGKILPISEPSQSDYIFVKRWGDVTNYLGQEKYADFEKYYFAHELAMSYLLGIGVLVDEQQAIKALYYAAQGALSSAMALFDAINSSISQLEHHALTHEELTWLSYGMRYNYHDVYDRARVTCPDLARTTREIMLGRLWMSDNMRALDTVNGINQLFTPNTSSIPDLKPRQYLLLSLQTLAAEGSLNQTVSIAKPKVRLLHIAACLAEIDMVKMLVEIEKVDINIPDEAGRLPIYFAAEKGDLETVRYLLEHGADATYIDPSGRCLLQVITFHNDDLAVELANILLAYDTPLAHIAVEKVESNWNNPFLAAKGIPLQWAASKNRYRLFGLILKAHYDRDELILGFFWMTLLQNISIYHRLDIFDLIRSSDLASQSNPQPKMMVRGFFPYMLRFTVHEPSYHSVGIRCGLGARFLSSQREFIERLISVKRDLSIDRGVELDAFEYALRCGDQQAVEILGESLSQDGYDVYKLLTNGTAEDSTPLFPITIKARNGDAFLYLLNKYPDLARFRIDGVGGMLHIAAMEGYPRHIRHLIGNGADVYDCDNVDECTPLEVALQSGKIDLAEIIIEGADIQRLFGPPSLAGNSLFGRLVSRISTIRNRVPLRTFEFLKKHQGLEFITNPKHGLSIWYTVFPMYFVSREDLVQQDLQLLDFLLQPDTFLDLIHEKDSSGKAAIHYAAFGGQYQYIKFLLDKGADINQEYFPKEDTFSSKAEEILQELYPDDDRPRSLVINHNKATTSTRNETQDSGTKISLRPMDLITRRISESPESVVAGGKEELVRWKRNCADLSDLLGKKSAWFGETVLAGLLPLLESMGELSMNEDSIKEPKQSEETTKGQD